MQRLIPWNVDERGVSKTILAGYSKFGWETFIGNTYGATGTIVIYVED